MTHPVLIQAMIFSKPDPLKLGVSLIQRQTSQQELESKHHSSELRVWVA